MFVSGDFLIIKGSLPTSFTNIIKKIKDIPLVMRVYSQTLLVGI